MIFRDESTFPANDDQKKQWRVKGEGMLRKAKK